MGATSLNPLEGNLASIKEVSVEDVSGGYILKVKKLSGLIRYVANNKLVADKTQARIFTSGGAGDVTANSATNFTNKTGNISQWTNNSGYLLPAAIANFITASSTTVLTNKSGAISQWTNDANYITSAALPVKATTSEANAATDDVKFVSASGVKSSIINTALVEMTITELMANIRTDVTAVQITDKNKTGLFLYDSTDTSTAHDGAMTIVDATTSRRYKREVSNDMIDVRWFGASTSSSNNTPFFNAASDFCRNSALYKNIYIPSGQWIVTQSINSNKNAINDPGISWYGHSKSSTMILATLNENYPVMDMSTNKRGGLYNLTIQTQSACLSSCTVLISQFNSTGGSLITLKNAQILNSGVNAKFAMIAVSADQLLLDQTQIIAYGPVNEGGFRLSRLNVTGVTSKFNATIFEDGSDCTYFTALNSQFSATNGPAVYIDSFSLVSLIQCYANVAGSNNTTTGIMKFASLTRFMQVDVVDFRSEDQTTGGAGALAVIEVEDKIYNSSFIGSFGGRTTTAVFTGPGFMYNTTFKGSSSGPVFYNAGPLIGGKFDLHAGANTIGTFAAGALTTSGNMEFSGRVGTESQLRTLFAGVQGVSFKNIAQVLSLTRRSANDGVWFGRADEVTGWGYAFSGDVGNAGIAAYTGGSGLQPITTVSFPTVVLSSAFLHFRSGKIVLRGMTASTWAGGTLSLKVDQALGTPVTANLASLASIPAGETKFEITIDIVGISVSGGNLNMICYSDITTKPKAGGAVYGSGTSNTLGVTFQTSSTVPIIFTLSVDSSITTPIVNLTKVLTSN